LLKNDSTNCKLEQSSYDVCSTQIYDFPSASVFQRRLKTGLVTGGYVAEVSALDFCSQNESPRILAVDGNHLDLFEKLMANINISETRTTVNEPRLLYVFRYLRT